MDGGLLVRNLIRSFPVLVQVVCQPLHVRLHVETHPWKRDVTRVVSFRATRLSPSVTGEPSSLSGSRPPSLSTPNAFSHTGFHREPDVTTSPVRMIWFNSSRAVPLIPCRKTLVFSGTPETNGTTGFQVEKEQKTVPERAFLTPRGNPGQKTLRRRGAKGNFSMGRRRKKHKKT